jgi:hypothetical protein
VDYKATGCGILKAVDYYNLFTGNYRMFEGSATWPDPRDGDPPDFALSRA